MIEIKNYKKYILIIIASVFLFNCNSQETAEQINTCFIKNNLEYEIAYYGLKIVNFDEGKFAPSKYVVDLNLPENQKECLSRLNYQDWITLLKNNQTDFDTNLILYFVFEREFFHLNEFNREIYIKSYKSEETAYWSKYLLNHVDEIGTRLNDL